MSMSDIEKCYNVKARHSLCVLGITDYDIIATFENYGVIVKVVRVAPSTEQTGQPIIIVEFDAHTPVTRLEPNFPLEIKSVRNPAVAWYADNIKVLAQPSSQPPAQAQSLSIESSDDSNNAVSEEVSSDNSDYIPKRYIKRQPLKKPKSKSRALSSDSKPDPAVRKKTPKPAFNTLTNDDLNPPEIQRIVVEHVIKIDAFSTQTHSKWLRSFSGKVPKPPGESDFDTWCLHIDLLLQDSLPIDIQRRKILESLLPPASDVVKQLGSTAPPRDYVKLLDSAYGLVEDGDEIFAHFLNTNQDPGEKASDYLQRLQTLLSTAVRRNGVKQSSADRQLLKQFQRGCWDHSLILTLQLEAKAKTPPDFAELLLLLRTEKDRRAAKLDRMQ
uniref:Paraneoplastic antigen Ma-like C-terminal domain-containing protein n=2 Tax=Cyprinus carpio TaxID=7962 RepID=A0A9J8BES4_CYPCA